jgi:hypothetical protein
VRVVSFTRYSSVDESKVRPSDSASLSHMTFGSQSCDTPVSIASCKLGSPNAAERVPVNVFATTKLCIWVTSERELFVATGMLMLGLCSAF